MVGTAASSGGNTPGVTDDTIMLGMAVPLTGHFEVGRSMVAGARAWFEFVNESLGGINGRKIKLKVEDTAGRPDQAVYAFRNLVLVEGVFLIVNSFVVPEELFAVLPVMGHPALKDVPVIALPGLTGPVEDAIKRLGLNLFRLSPNFEVWGTALAQYAVNKLPGKQIAVINSIDDLGGNQLYKVFTAELKKNGITPVSVKDIHCDWTDFTSIVRQLKQANAEVVVLLFNCPLPFLPMLIQARVLGFRPQWLGPGPAIANGATFILQILRASDPEGGEGWLVPAMPFPADADTLAARQYRKLLEKYAPTEKPGFASAISYVGAQLVVEALRSAGRDLTREKFIKELNSLVEWRTGLTPPITYTPEDHEGIQDVIIFQVEKGKFVPRGIVFSEGTQDIEDDGCIDQSKLKDRPKFPAYIPVRCLPEAMNSTRLEAAVKELTQSKNKAASVLIPALMHVAKRYIYASGSDSLYPGGKTDLDSAFKMSVDKLKADLGVKRAVGFFENLGLFAMQEQNALDSRFSTIYTEGKFASISAKGVACPVVVAMGAYYEELVKLGICPSQQAPPPPPPTPCEQFLKTNPPDPSISKMWVADRPTNWKKMGSTSNFGA